jgi:GNAT superfamily N-acetyltransferase
MPFRAAATGIAAFNILGETLDENYHGRGVGRALANEVERIATERESLKPSLAI